MTSPSAETLTRLVGRIYEAAYDQDSWPDVMTRLRDLTKGSRSCILQLGPDTSGAVSSEPDPDLKTPEAGAAILREPVAAKAMELPLGIVRHWPPQDEQDGFRRREVWQHWFRPRDMDHWLVCKLESTATSHLFLNVHRASRHGGFGDDEVRLMQLVTPHLARAGALSRRFTGNATLEVAFRQLNIGVLLVDAQSRLLRMNEAAERILASPDSSLRLIRGRISARMEKDTKRIWQLVSQVCPQTADAAPAAGGAIMLSPEAEPLQHASTVVSIAPVSRASAFGFASESCALLMVRAPSPAADQAFQDHIRDLFDLTQAEARLAAALASGHSIKQSALALNLTIKTGRTYLDRIFAKTRTHHQSELVALLKNSELMVRPPN